jgi:multiple sugar transport system ATP-binding protein
MATVTMDHITKKFGEVVAVNDLNIEVRDEEFLVLVGPSGCGKTTALRMVAGLEEQTTGDIFIGERKVNDVPPKDRDIAMVFQNYALYPHMSVFDNLSFGLRLRGVPKDEIKRRVEAVAQMLGLERLLQRKPKELSGGQRQRVALGRAIVREPKVFLMDEPLSNLDAKLRVQTRADLLKLHQRVKTTTIYVTHDQVEAMTMGDRIAVMKDGLLQQLDTPQTLHDRPANLFVAGFIGSPAMNFFEGTLVGTPDDPRVDTGVFSAPVPPESRQSAREHVGKKVIYGIRPEDINPPGPAGQGQSVNAKVEVVEYLGNELQLHGSLDGKTFIARIPTEVDTHPGAFLTLWFDARRAHLFDATSERALR